MKQNAYSGAYMLFKAPNIKVKGRKIMSIHPDLDTLETLLKTHDWTYNYSDDHRAWKKGNEQSDEIRRQMDICCGLGLDTVARELYNKHRPEYMS
jgi:hypothetical protein